MNKREKQVAAASLRNEAEVLEELKRNYAEALENIERTLEILNRRLENAPSGTIKSIIWQKQYQESLRAQLNEALDVLASNNFTTISQYLAVEYEIGYIGAMYSIAGQGIPLTLPINQKRVAKMIETTGANIKLSETMYSNAKKLKKVVRNQVSVGFASGLSYQDIAANLEKITGLDYNRAVRIARTEGGRVANGSAFDAIKDAKKRGCDVVKQWDAALDMRTRTEHRMLDGQVREVDEPFEVDGYEAMYPHGFGKPWLDINCRCRMTQRAKWALDDDELKVLKQRAEFFGLDKTKDFDEFARNYKVATVTDF